MQIRRRLHYFNFSMLIDIFRIDSTRFQNRINLLKKKYSIIEIIFIHILYVFSVERKNTYFNFWVKRNKIR